MIENVESMVVGRERELTYGELLAKNFVIRIKIGCLLWIRIPSGNWELDGNIISYCTTFAGQHLH